jgi:transposase
MRHAKLRTVTEADHAQVLRLLADRHRQLRRARTQTVNRLHALLAGMLEGGLPRGPSADRAAVAMRRIRPISPLDIERKKIAAEVLADVRRLDAQLKDLRSRIVTAVEASASTVPIEASSGPRVRHRLNRRGNRQLNHALHVAAIAQLSRDTPGRAYFERKVAEGKSKKEAIRSLKRRISDAVYRQLILDARG